MTVNPSRLWTQKTVIYCLVLIAAGIILRCKIMTLGLTQDESVSCLISLKELPELLATAKVCDYNPPLVLLVMHFIFQIFGVSAVIDKLPEFLCWVFTIPAVYLLGAVSHSRSAGIMAAICATFSRQTLFYACFGRPFSLAMLLGCLLLTFYILSLREPKNRSWLTLMSLVALIFLYSHYSAQIYIVILSACSAIFWLKLKQRLIPYVVALGLPCLIYAPWLPTMLNQSRSGFPWYEAHLPGQLPLIVASNLSVILPLPAVPSLIMTACSVFIFFCACLFLFRVKKVRRQAVRVLERLGKPGFVLLVMTIIPCCLMGVVTPYYFGLFRYMYPFLVPGWVLGGMVLTELARFLSARSTTFADRIKATAIVALVIILGCSIMESFQLSKLQQSGFETLVQDISDHNYDDTLLIVAPTQDMRTFLFDTRGVALGSYKVQARCFYQWDTDSIFDREANCAGWTSPILVKDFLTKIKTETGHYKCLAITEPHFCPSTHAMPCRQQINQLLSECDHQYRPIRQKDYAGGQESFRLHLYEFKETPASLNSALQPR